MDGYEFDYLARELDGAWDTKDSTDVLIAILDSNLTFDLRKVKSALKKSQNDWIEFYFIRADLTREDILIDIRKFISRMTFSINHELSNGETLLTQAIYRRNYKLVKLVLKYDADVNVTNNSDDTPLDVAVEVDQKYPGIETEKIKKLLQSLS